MFSDGVSLSCQREQQLDSHIGAGVIRKSCRPPAGTYKKYALSKKQTVPVKALVLPKVGVCLGLCPSLQEISEYRIFRLPSELRVWGFRGLRVWGLGY